MCIAVWKPADKIIPKETLLECFNSNPDGAGVMTAKDGVLTIKKGFFSFESFWEYYKDKQELASTIHFRIKTHGTVDEENCHPFIVAEGFAFVHNGIISKVDTKGDLTKSDTWHFNEMYIKPMARKVPAFLSVAPIISLMKEFIGYSKLIFMDNKGRVSIVNEDKGEWFDGVWYSNSSYKQKKIATVHTPNSAPLIQGDTVFLTVDNLDKGIKGDELEVLGFGMNGKIFTERKSDKRLMECFHYQISRSKIELFSTNDWLEIIHSFHNLTPGEIVTCIEDKGTDFIRVETFDQVPRIVHVPRRCVKLTNIFYGGV